MWLVMAAAEHSARSHCHLLGCRQSASTDPANAHSRLGLAGPPCPPEALGLLCWGCPSHSPACSPLPALTPPSLPAGPVPSRRPCSGTGNSLLFVLKMKIVLCCENGLKSSAGGSCWSRWSFTLRPSQASLRLGARRAGSTVTATCLLPSCRWRWESTRC